MERVPSSVLTQDLYHSLERLIVSRWAPWAFFFFSFIIFSPLFIWGDSIVATTDSIFNHFPNLVFGRDELRNGGLGLWNPYLFCGTNFLSSIHHHILNPLNAVLALVPEQWMFQALTFIQFLEVGGVGLFAYRSLQRLLQNPVAVFFSAVTVQLSCFTWFTATTFIGVEFFFCALAMIYVIVSYYERRRLLNFFYVTLLAFAMFVEGHIAYIAAFFIPVAIFFFWHHRKRLLNGFHSPLLTVGSATVFAFIMSLYRLYPILFADEILEAADISFKIILAQSSLIYLVLTGFIPTIFGFNLTQAEALLGLLELEGVHTQYHNWLYFSTPVLFLFFLSLKGCFSRAATVLSRIILLFLFGTVLFFQPFLDLFILIFSPFSHMIIPRVLLSFFFFFITARSFQNILELRFQWDQESPRHFSVILGFVMLLVTAFYLHCVERMVGFDNRYLLVGAKFLTLCVVGSLVWFSLFWQVTDKSIRQLTNIARSAAILAFAAIFVFSPDFVTVHYLRSAALYFLGLFVWVLICLTIQRRDVLRWHLKIVLIASFCFCLFILVFIHPGIHGPGHAYIAVLLGVTTALVLFTSCIELFHALRKNRTSQLGPILILGMLLTGDLLFFTKIYSYVGGPSFASSQFLYPEIAEHRRKIFEHQLITLGENEKLDLQNYRVNRPGFYFLYPYFPAYSNAFMNYKIRSFGGVDSLVKPQTQRFVEAFANSQECGIERFGIHPNTNSIRLLQLTGVKYNFESPDKISVIPKAIPRFSAYAQFVVEPDVAKAYALLKDPDFAIEKLLVLNARPQDPPGESESNLQPLPFEEINSDKIQLHLQNNVSKIILFNDSFDAGWKATWNGRELPILLANGYFMAVSVPVGNGTLTFRFCPSYFPFLIKLTLSMMSALGLLGGYLLWSRLRQKQFVSVSSVN